MPTDPKKILARHAQLQQIRQPFEAHWESIAEVMMPRKRGILSRGKQREGQKLTDYQYDGTGTRSAEKLASFMHGSMTASNFPWFGLQTRNVGLMDLKAVADWLEECAERMLAAFAMSNWDSEAPEAYLDNISFGTASPMFIEEDEIRPGQKFGGLKFTAISLGDAWCAENRRRVIDTVYWLTSMAACEVVDEWPDTASDTTKQKAINRPYDPVNILLAVEPRRGARTDGRERPFAWEMPYACYYLESDRRILLEEKGFHEFPAPTPRWSRGNGERIYGRGLGDSAYPDVRTLNEAVRYKLMSLAMALFPPLLKDVGLAGSIRWLPGAVHDVNGKALGMNPAVQPILNGARFDVAEVEEEKMRAVIQEAFHAGLLQLPEKEMTAQEAHLRIQLMMRVLGPGVLGRHKSEFLDPTISRSFGMMLRAGALPPPPQEILQAPPEERSIDVVYKGPLAAAQRSQDTLAIDSQVDATLSVYERSEDPDVLDTIDFDEAMWSRAQGGSVPSKVMRSKDQVAERRAARAKAQQDLAAREDRTAMADEMLKTAQARKAAAEAGDGMGERTRMVPEAEMAL
ncbi:MAG TPA: portal protein [Thermodesulfobacteriota bacterium]|nr:portal protein [Thermodesulfobacteriota bacterium]